MIMEFGRFVAIFVTLAYLHAYYHQTAYELAAVISCTTSSDNFGLLY